MLPGTIDGLAASANHVAAVRGGEVWLLADQGGVTARLNAAHRYRSVAPGDGRAASRQAESILDRYGVSELDRDSDWAADLIHDERTLAERRGVLSHTESLTTLAEPVLLAASRADLWIALGQRWLRVARDGQIRREAWRGAAHAVAAASQRLLLARPDGLTLVSTEAASQLALGTAAGAQRVALSASGVRWAWSGADRVEWNDGTVAGHFELSRGAVDLGFCGEDLLVLLPDALLVVRPGAAPSTRTNALRAHRVLCPEGAGGPWLAVGRALSLSADGGRTWKAIATPPGPALVDVAVTAHSVWLATSTGLFVSADAQDVPTLAGAAGGPARARRRRPSAWLSWLPRVSIEASASSGTSRRELAAFALAQFALGGEPAAGVPEPRPAGAAAAAALERLADPPDLERECLGRTRRKAVEAALAEPSRAESYVRRAGRAAWLPELRLLVSRRYGRSESLDVATSSTALSSPLGIDTVNDIRYEARATWDLAKLVFSHEELAAQNQALHMAELRRDIETTVNRLYFERRRLSLESGAGAAVRKLRFAEIGAELDALSAGTFTTCLAEKTPSP